MGDVGLLDVGDVGVLDVEDVDVLDVGDVGIPEGKPSLPRLHPLQPWPAG